MVLVVVVLAAFFAAALTLLSGFGLGTLLLPAFALLIDLEVAVAATAVVHLANNLFKAGMLWRFADPRVVLVFGVPAMLASFGGAQLLRALAVQEPLARWQLGDRTCLVTPAGLAIGALVAAFALFELWPRARQISFDRRWLPLGGALSGFLGGLSGHQGALRSAFLLRLGLPKEVYIGTGILCAVLVDVVRIPSYDLGRVESWPVVLAGIAAAFGGSYLGRHLMTRVTMDAIHRLVGALLAVVGAAIAAGIV